MPSGKTHDRITLWCLPLVVLVAFRVTLDGWLTGVTCLGFLVGGWMFGPDLDIHSVQYKRWGWLRWIWLPYRSSMRHRSPLSHGPLIGTIVRVLYFFLWLAFFGILMVGLLNGLGQTALTWEDLRMGLTWGIRQHWPYGLALLVGLELGALSHSVSDWLVSRVKQTRRQQKRITGKRRSRGSARRRTPQRFFKRTSKPSPKSSKQISKRP